MINRYTIKTIAIIELMIGFGTLSGIAWYTHLALQAKPMNVLVFVTAAAAASAILGMGLFEKRKWAATLLVFFSGYIILNKAMIAGGLLHFNGEIITSIPLDIKNLVSILYHSSLILFLARPSVRNTLR